MSNETHVRIAGVCNCEVFEHCEKCDPEYFKKTPLIAAFVHLTIKQQEEFNNGGKPVILTPDDILTLRLLRDNYLPKTSINPKIHAEPFVSKYQINDTLNRIFKQVE